MCLCMPRAPIHLEGAYKGVWTVHIEARAQSPGFDLELTAALINQCHESLQLCPVLGRLLKHPLTQNGKVMILTQIVS
jgi:hypothetical protein